MIDFGSRTPNPLAIPRCTVDQQGARPQDRIPRPDHRQLDLLLGRAMFHRFQQLYLGPRRQRQLARVHRIVFCVAGNDPLQLARIGYDHIMTQPLQFPADPG